LVFYFGFGSENNLSGAIVVVDFDKGHPIIMIDNFFDKVGSFEKVEQFFDLLIRRVEHFEERKIGSPEIYGFEELIDHD